MGSAGVLLEMSKTVTCFEYGKFNLELRYKEEIEKMNKSLGEVFRCKVKDGKLFLKSKQYAGLINIKGNIIQILPKIYKKDETDEEMKRRQAIKNLVYMLNYAQFENRVKYWDAAAVFEKFDDIFEVLIYLFSKNLSETIRKGVYRNYITVEENVSGALRGKLLVHKHATTNFISKEKFYVEYDEFSENNLLNRVFRFAIELLLKLSKNDTNKKLLRDLKFLFSDVEHQEITDSDLKRITFNRLNEHYRQPFNMAKMFIQKLWYPDYLERKDEIYAFLIDMNQLFEDFLAQFIKRHRADILPEKYKDSKILIQRAKRYLVTDKSSAYKYFQLKPDIILKKGEKFVLIIDAKYKELKPEEPTLGVSQGDMYQMYAYVTKYDSPKGVFVYPEYKESVKKEFCSDEKEICVRTINLLRDLSEDEEELKEELKGILD
jgi:5-methylcytosine-specific restriction enzyme subunit McrC